MVDKASTTHEESVMTQPGFNPPIPPLPADDADLTGVDAAVDEPREDEPTIVRSPDLDGDERADLDGEDEAVEDEEV